MSSHSVTPFDKIELFRALAGDPCKISDLEAVSVPSYLFAYLQEIGVQTIVTEFSYVDADYLDDYAHFYAKSFVRIPNRCRRLHFFTTAISATQFQRWVGGEDDASSLQEWYAGFVVARPLPAATVGRTVLKTYPSDSGRRHYPAIRSYSVNLFGVDLTVSSLGFQVQDTSLAACATVALWSCFQKTQKLFASAAPTPVAITRAANQYFLSARPFPSRGLQIQQVCNAIVSVGLDPEVYQVSAALPLASLIYSYLRLGVPVLAIVSIPSAGQHALHAICLTGYSLRDSQQLGAEGGDVDKLLPKLIGARIDEFYGHDDQMGPFRRLKLKAATDASSSLTFTDSGWNGDIKPVAIIVPVYPKIRTGFRDVLPHVMAASSVAAWAAKASDFEWDIFLSSSNEFKTGLRTGTIAAPQDLRNQLLLEGFPKYIWRCSLRVSGRPYIDMILDTTEMVSGFPIRHFWWHEAKAKAVSRFFLTNAAFEKVLLSGFAPRFLELLRNAAT